MNSTKQKSKSRKAEIKRLWDTRLYTMEEIAKRFQVSRQRIHAILKSIDYQQPMSPLDIDWAVVRKLRLALGIRARKSTDRAIEKRSGSYKNNVAYQSVTGYLVYVLEEALKKSLAAEAMIKQLEKPTLQPKS